MRKSEFMEVTVEHLGGVKFEVAAREHRVLCDQPRDNGGSDSGMTPPEFLLASLGTCAAYYAAEYLKIRKLMVPNLTVKVTAEKALRPARLATFRIDVTAPGLDEKHELGLQRAAKACLIHNTLLARPGIEVIVNQSPARMNVETQSWNETAKSSLHAN